MFRLVINPFTTPLRIEDDLYELFIDIYKDIRLHNIKDN